ncbi:reverse transcriptase domain-containing protein [Tanacetum coccineum]
MTTSIEKRNHAKFCKFHGEVGHTTDECMHLKKQIEEMLKAGKLWHLIKEIKQNIGKEQPIAAKKGETYGKDKSLTILMAEIQEVASGSVNSSRNAEDPGRRRSNHLKKQQKSDFCWTAEAEEAFKQMKRLIAKLPMLVTPIEKEELIVYLAASKETGIKGSESKLHIDGKVSVGLGACQFGLPGEIISDNEKQFQDNPFKDWCEKLCIRQHFASVKHPQTNGLSSNGDTPFSLTYGTEAVIPAEIGMPTLRTAEVDPTQNNEALEINLDLLEERREQAAIREAKSKAKMEKYYNSKVRSMSLKLEDLVYHNNEASHAEDTWKLGPKWEGSYEVTKEFRKGA